MSQLFKRVAVVAGTGLAAALASVSSGPARKKPDLPDTAQSAPDLTSDAEPEVPVSHKLGVPADDVLYLDPLFDRLEAIERRLELAALNPPPPPAVAVTEVAVSEDDFSALRAEFRALRQELAERSAGAEAQVSALVTRVVQEQVAEAEARLAALSPASPPVAPAVSERFVEIERQLQHQAEALQSLRESAERSGAAEAQLPALVTKTVQEQVSAADKGAPERLGALERILQEHAASIHALNERLDQTDSNMQRLVTVISRMIEGPGLPGQQSPPQPARAAHASASFEAHLNEAMSGEPSPQDQVEFRSRIIQEPDTQGRRPRVPMSRIL